MNNIVDNILKNSEVLETDVEIKEASESQSLVKIDDNKEETKPLEKIQHSIIDVENNLLEDFQKSRTVLNRLLDLGLENIKNLSIVAIDSDSPRAYEVVSNLIGSITDTSNSLMEIHHKKAIIENLKQNGVVGKNTSITDIGTIQNAIFVGTASDVMAALPKLNLIENITDAVILDPKPESSGGIDFDDSNYIENDEDDYEEEITKNIIEAERTYENKTEDVD